MTPVLRVIEAGACCSVQDAGRKGWLRQGVASAGPMDWIAFEQARRLAEVGPARGSSELAGIEVSVGGLVLEASGGPVRLGLAGGQFSVHVEGRLVRHPASVLLEAGSRLSIRAGGAGAWFYAVPYPGIALPAVMGSYSTHVRYGLGGNGGRMLQAGTCLPLGRGSPFGGADIIALPVSTQRDRIRVMLGPQQAYFDSDALHEFLASDFRVSLRADRMAYFLQGPRIFPQSTYDIVSDATVLGSVQVAGDGAPCVLLADRPPTGGYPKIATIIRADVGRLAQRRAGECVRFEAVGIGEAIAALSNVRERLRQVSLSPRPFAINLEALARGDDATGVWAGFGAEGAL